MKKALRAIESLTFKTLVFLLPTQLALHLWPDYSYIFGLKIDYLSPTLYLTDILIFILFVCWILNRPLRLRFDFNGKFKSVYLLGLILLGANVFFSQLPEVSLIKGIKLFEFIFFGFYTTLFIKLYGFPAITGSLYASMIIPALLGINNFLVGSTMGGPFYFLGERSFNITTPGMALVEIFGKDYLRAYGTFSHPNSFAGFVGIIIQIYLFTPFKKTKLQNLIFVLSIISLAITFSLSANISIVVAVVVGFVYMGFKQKNILLTKSLYLAVIISIFFLLISPNFTNTQITEPNIRERVVLIQKSAELISYKLTTGVGMGNFTVAAFGQPKYKFLYSEVQPVHNIFLLTLVEGGVLLFVFAIYIVGVFLKLVDLNRHFWVLPTTIFILLTGLTDHYWLTLQQNALLIALLCGVSLTKK